MLRHAVQMRHDSMWSPNLVEHQWKGQQHYYRTPSSPPAREYTSCVSSHPVSPSPHAAVEVAKINRHSREGTWETRIRPGWARRSLTPCGSCAHQGERAHVLRVWARVVSHDEVRLRGPLAADFLQVFRGRPERLIAGEGMGVNVQRHLDYRPVVMCSAEGLFGGRLRLHAAKHAFTRQGKIRWKVREEAGHVCFTTTKSQINERRCENLSRYYCTVSTDLPVRYTYRQSVVRGT